MAGSDGMTGKTWRDGDFNGDGRVDGADFSVLASSYATRLPPSRVATRDPVRRRQDVAGW